jgi:transposase
MLTTFVKITFMTREEKQMRRFSEAFKREKVEQLELNRMTVQELSDLYEVTRSAIYKWVAKYGHKKSGERMVVEKESEGSKTKQLQERLKNREQEIGRQHIEIRYLQAVIAHWSGELGEDLEKKVERPF